MLGLAPRRQGPGQWGVLRQHLCVGRCQQPMHGDPGGACASALLWRGRAMRPSTHVPWAVPAVKLGYLP